MDEESILKIKPEYLITNHVPKLAVECVPEEDKKHLENVDGGNRRGKNYKKSLFRGQNKSRKSTFQEDEEKKICNSLINIGISQDWPVCDDNNCKRLHDMTEYLRNKQHDIEDKCTVFESKGFCPRGVTCRYSKHHITEDGRNIIDETKYNAQHVSYTNFLSRELQLLLWKKKYDFSKSDAAIQAYDVKKEILKQANGEIECKMNVENGTKTIGPITDENEIAVCSREKKKIDWSDKTYLSPLTTLGNLPFRRICKEFGVDVTCGEMAMASSLLQGKQNEWALTRRHESENLFGIQICGNNPYIMTKCAQLLQENTDADFIDVNLGCPIDLVYREGSGSGLLHRENTLKAILGGMSGVLDIPLTIKTRVGINREILHTLIPSIASNDLSLITIHGRTKDQRYIKSSNWRYVNRCARLADNIPVFGNGDVMSYEDYYNKKELYPNIKGIMIGRGALIKPWIFEEINEKKHWDISSRERLDILKKYVNYGLDHWGSDTKGVENTRRFLLEWLSFLCRYVPVGLLEYPPQLINQYVPTYNGRDELETLMASHNCADWIRISEMLLGPVPDGFTFLPKHKASSWK